MSFCFLSVDDDDTEIWPKNAKVKSDDEYM